MKERLSKLLTVKSIVTIILTVVFAYLSVMGMVEVDQFLTVFTVIIAFYFGTQAEKAQTTGSGSKEAYSSHAITAGSEPTEETTKETKEG